jgi:glycogen debranching enzyme
VYPDGSQVTQPKALCELQGYVFDAWLRRRRDVRGAGDQRARRRAAAEGRELRHRFEEAFWCEDVGFYAFALDKDKQPVKTIASNPGHLLWSGKLHGRIARSV